MSAIDKVHGFFVLLRITHLVHYLLKKPEVLLQTRSGSRSTLALVVHSGVIWELLLLERKCIVKCLRRLRKRKKRRPRLRLARSRLCINFISK